MTQEVEKKWTIIVYMAGDNNLSEDMITGLRGMMSFADNAPFNLIALYDGNYPPIPVKVYDFTSPREDEQQSSKAGLGRYEIDLADPKRPEDPSRFDSYTLRDFVPAVLKRYKTERYALFLSGHGDGIIGRVLLRDESPNIVLDIQKLRQILEEIRPTNSEGVRVPFDILGFDSCLMSMLEVAREFASIADVLVASQGNIPSSGWTYSNVLSELNKNGDISAVDLARSIVEKYTAENEDYSVSGRSVNISACNLRGIGPVCSAISSLAGHLNPILDASIDADLSKGIFEETANANLRARARLLRILLAAHHQSQTFMHNQAVDLIDFVENLILEMEAERLEHLDLSGSGTLDAPSPDLANQVSQDHSMLMRALDSGDQATGGAFIIASGATGNEYRFSRGVSIFLPWTYLALDLLYQKYSSMEFNAGDNEWLRFIDNYTLLTLRFSPKESFADLFAANFKSESLKLYGILHRQHGDKQHGDRQHGDRQHGDKGSLESFYRFFSQIRNYATELNE